MILCFGTYASVLKLASRYSNDRMLVSTLVGTIDPDNRYEEESSTSAVSRLMNCRTDFPNILVGGSMGPFRETDGSLTHVVQMAGNMAVSDLIPAFDDVVGQMYEDKKKPAVAALQKIIQSDSSLRESHRETFVRCMGATADTVAKQNRISLSAFLAGILLYTILINQNSDDGGTLANIKKKDFLDQFLDAEIEWIKTDEENHVPDSDSISDYLQGISEKYSKMKTLLYYDEPHAFYDFFVCNTLVKFQQVQNDNRYELTEISDVNPEKLAEQSSYAIISAYGGMGKSMMMRHFLLHTVKEYDHYGKLPIFVQLKDYKGGSDHKDLRSFIYNSSVHLMAAFTYEQFINMLASGQFLILLDGLDELGSMYQDDFEIALDRFTDLYPHNQYIMSSRPFTDFVSFAKFTTYHVSPFTSEQSLELVDKLVFRPDDPSIKQKFITALKNGLMESHRSFVSNPLLLTIMMMTFDQIAEISPRMHIFYRDAYAVLAQRHDASKGAYKRQLHTGLSSDQFADYFAEFCARSYVNEDYEMDQETAKQYFDVLKERKKHPEIKATAQDFLDDLCNNICLMFKEGGQYLFTHRSFQEYFCAVFFSKQRDKDLEKIGKWFERNHKRIFFSETFQMLYDMIPEKVDEYILMPFLDNLIQECEQKDGYWTYLEKMYPRFCYGEEGQKTSVDPEEAQSFLAAFISDHLNTSWNGSYYYKIPLFADLLTDKFVVLENSNDEFVDIEEVSQDYIDEYGMPEIVATGYMFDVHAIREKPKEFKPLLDMLENDEFPTRKEYEALKRYRDDLHSRYDHESEDLFDFL